MHDRRLAIARLHQEDAAKTLFTEIAPAFKDRRGGYTRIIRLHERQGDASQLAILEFVNFGGEVAPEPETSKTEAQAKPAEEKEKGKAAEAKA
jgi:large subunit ribosomal protein L17